MADINNATFGWDDEIENESSFVLFPAGNYKFTVTGFEREYYPGGEKIPACNKANVTLTVEDEFGRKCDINDGLFLIQRMEWKLCQFFVALGLRKHGERSKMPWDKILGKSGMCRLIVNDYETKDGKKRQNNKIDAYLDPEDFPLPAPKTAVNNGWKGGF